jgi:Ca2+-transporting ATPase
VKISTLGLSDEESARLLARHGFNELPSPEKRSVWRIVREVLSEPMFGLLLAAGVIYFFLGDVGEAVTLLVFANLSVSIAVVQETRSERVLEALRELTNPRALVLRGGRRLEIPGREVVPGDLLLVAEGDRVPADAVLVDGEGVLADESLLTGESMPVRKRVLEGDEYAAGTPGGDDFPALYSGTLVVRGSGRAVVVSTGASTEIGRIGRSLGTIHPEPPRLLAQTRRLVRLFGTIGILLSALVVTLYTLLRGSFLDGLLAGIAVGMSLLPEEFPLVLTVFMVMGAWRISRARVLTRRGSAIESLGAATVLCTDKTGTLTYNRMSIVRLHAVEPGPGEERTWSAPRVGAAGDAVAGPVRRVLSAGLLASSRDALDPMDRAFHDLAIAMLDDAKGRLEAHRVLVEFGLTPELPVMTSVCEVDGGWIAVTKGAPEAVASLCRLDEEAKTVLAGRVERMASEGIRVLAVGEARLDAGTLPSSPREIAFSFVGLAGFADPLREEVPAAVAECRRAGVRVVMITGDHPVTARAIAAEAGLQSGVLMTGRELEVLSDDELAARVREVSVFARILPEQKLRIVEALQAAGEVVAMTGDGVNDAPSLRAAHIGIAMGKRGTDVAREASAIVLLDDDFGSIVKTIRLGRRIYDNLRKAMGYVVALHLPIAGLAVLPLLLGMPLMLTPTIIAFLEMIIDPVCSVVFEAEPEEPGIMDRPPRSPEAALLPGSLLVWHVVQGTISLSLVTGVFVLAYTAGLPEREVRSVVFTALVMTTIALIFANRSFTGSTIDMLRRSNPLLWWAVGSAAAMLAVVLRWPPARDLFRLGPIHAHDLAACAVAAGILHLSLQVLKGRWKGSLQG